MISKTNTLANYSVLPDFIRKAFFARSGGIEPRRVNYNFNLLKDELQFTIEILVGSQIMTIKYSVSIKAADDLSNTGLVAIIVDKAYEGYLAEVDKMADEFMEGKV